MSEEATTKKSKSNVQVWWSVDSPRHNVLVPVRTASGDLVPDPKRPESYLHKALIFNDYRLELDLNDKIQARDNQSLREHVRCGAGFFRLVDGKFDGERRLEFRCMLENLCDPEFPERRGKFKLLALFSKPELDKNEISQFNLLDRELVRLRMIAEDTKNIKSAEEE